MLIKNIYKFICKLKRYLVHLLKKPFLNNFFYKYFPRFFLYLKFSSFRNVNTNEYWSSVHLREAERPITRFDDMVLPLLNNINFRNKDVLEVGCARGNLLKKIVGAKSLTGVDISSTAIEELKRSGINGYVRTLPNINLNSNYDIILCFETLEHVYEWKSSIREMIKILRPDGYLVISVPLEDSILTKEHVNYFDVNRLYNFLKRKITVLDIKLFGAWLIVVGINKKYGTEDIPKYFFNTTEV